MLDFSCSYYRGCFDKMKYLYKQVKKAKGKYQSFANRIILEKIFDPLTWLVANFTRLTPNQLSFIGFAFGFLGAFMFIKTNFLLGAICWELSNLFDTFDGRIARLKGKNRNYKFGEYIDAYGGYWVLFALIFGLSLGLYFEYGSIKLLVLGFLLYFFMTVHFTEGLLVRSLIAGSKAKYEEKIVSFKKECEKGILTKLFNFQRKISEKYGLEEPLNLTDMEHLTLFVIPVVSSFIRPIYLEAIIIAILCLTLHSLIWFLNYKRMLRAG